MVHFLPTQFYELSVLVKENTEKKQIETITRGVVEVTKITPVPRYLD